MSSKWFIKDRKLKIAVLGCGRIAFKHMEAIKDNPHLELIGVCDRYDEARINAIEKFDTQGYRTLNELLEQTDVDIVTLCTPSGLHAQQTIEIAKAGRHVITEKPMATRWHDALDMIHACDEADVRLFVVKQLRQNPLLQQLKHAFKTGRFGRVYMVTTNVFWQRPEDYYQANKWRGTWEYDGGALMNQASHYVDLLCWLNGPISEIQTIAGTLSRQIEVEDTIALNLQWRNGAIGSMAVTMLTYPKNLEASITVLGEKGTVKLGGTAANVVESWEFETSIAEDETVHQLNENNSGKSGHAQYYEHVVNALQDKSSDITDGREGLKSFEVLIGAYRSARDKQPIYLPFEL